MGVFDGLRQTWGQWRATWASPPIGLGLGAVSVAVRHGCGSDYALSPADIYRRSPPVRTCVDFLARNLAQLPIHVYRRLPDDSRERLRDHPLAQLLAAPNPTTTTYRLINGTVSDVCITGFALWAKVRPQGRGLQLIRLPASACAATWLPGAPADGLEPLVGVTWAWPNGAPGAAALRDLVHFRLYDTDPGTLGLSPLDTLADEIATDRAAAKHAKAYWLNGSRPAGVIERPLDAPRWTPEQKARFVESVQAAGPLGTGQMLVLDDGMTFRPTSYNNQESQTLELKKLTRESVAALYQIPAPMVGILDHATYSNIREQHKQLYQDCLGPWIVMLEQELERALLPEFADTQDIYLEFLIDEKLRGALEEQAAAIRTLVGTPVMSVNESRARLNLPALEDPAFQVPVVPLNVDAGQAAQDQALAQAQAAGTAARAA